MSVLSDGAPAEFPLLFEAHPQAMMLFDRDTLQIVAVNEACARLYDYPRERLTRMTALELRPAEEVPFFLQYFRTRAGGAHQQVAARHRRSDGSVFDVEIVGSDIELEGRQLRLVLVRDITEQRRAEAAQGFLAEAGAALAGSLDVNATLREVAALAVPLLADYCTIHLLDEDGVLRQVAAAHRDPEREPLVQQMAEWHTRELSDPISVFARVARTGVGELFENARADGMLSGRGGEPLKRFTSILRPRSYVVAPLLGRKGTVGILQLTQAESGRRFGMADLELANELGRRAGMALENARLYQSAREELEQRRAAEEALRQSEARFLGIFNSAPVGILLLDMDGRITDANPSATRLLGAPDGLRGRNMLSFSTPEDADVERGRLADLIAGASDGYELEIRLRRSDGSAPCMRVSTFRVAAPGGARPLVVRVMEDVTERHRSEEALARLAMIADASREAIFGLDLDGYITSWNAGASRLFGYTAAEIVGKHLNVLVAPQHHEHARSAIEAATRGEHESAHTTPVRKDGTRVSVTSTLSPIRDAGGRVVALGYIGHDETERLALEEQLQHAQRLEAVGRLAGGVAHDFNNILTGIKGHSAFLLEALAPGDPRRAEVEEIDRAANRAAALTRQLLAFGRRQVLQSRELQLNSVVNEMESMLRRVIGEDVRLTTTLDRTAGAVRADPNQLQQVILNLVVNARDAMPAGGAIRIRTERLAIGAEAAELPPGDYAVLVVEDTGVGISPDVLPHIFEPFYTTKDAGAGTGLGLATVYGIVSQSGGTVRVESEPGRGSCFRVLLPRVADAAPSAPATVSAARRPVGEEGHETILLVEDEPPVREVAGRILRAAGYTVLMAASGEEALGIAGRHPEPIHLLLSDVVLPGVGGRIVAERLTATRPGTRVLFVSGYAEDAVLRRGTLQRGMHFLEKPFSPGDLRRKVRAVLDERR